MPAPTTSLATLRPDLAGSLTEFDLQANQGGFVARQVLPVMNVAKSSGSYGIIPIEQLLQERDTARAPGSGYARGNWEFDDATYVTKEHGAEEPIDDSEREMYSDYFDAELIATARARSAVLVNAEKRAAAAVFNASTWNGAALTTTVGTAWATIASSTPIVDVENAVIKVYEGSGLWPNALVINRLIFRKLRNTTEVINRIQSSGAGSPTKASDITVDMLRAVFDLDYIIVAGGTRNSAIEGQSAVPGQIWGSGYAMVCKIATTNDMREPCIGRTFHWAQDGSMPDGVIESYREEQKRSDIVRHRHQVAEVILYPEAGHLLDIAP